MCEREMHEETIKAFSTTTNHREQPLDAGALFVLKSKGSWWHSGYHLTTSIVAPTLLSLPFALASLGWIGGVLSLVIGAMVTFYSYNLISLVLEHHAELGHRHLRFRDMAYDILGSWWHSGYHLTTSIVAPTLLSLPFALASLGWIGGVMSLVIGAMVTFYSYNLISLVLEHHAELGHRHLRFRDMAYDILGPGCRYYVGPIQFVVCYGTVVGQYLVGGQCLKTIYVLWNPNITMKLYQFIIIFGVLMLILAQIPSFHSLRHINLISLVLSLLYSASATAASIYIGSSSKGGHKNYSLSSNDETRIFGIFNAIAIIGTSYGNGIIPEIQATLAPPVKGKMFKGLCVCYTVVIATFFSVAVSGYWAFGNESASVVLNNFLDHDGNPLVPRWFIMMINIFVIFQLSAVAAVYLQPTNEVLERTFSDPTSGEFSARNVIPRVISRSISVILVTTIAAMLPFFGDINAIIGAFGFLPLDFVLPMVFFNLTFKPSKKSSLFWLNSSIAVIFSVVSVIAAVAAIRQISLDAKTYKLFANV